MDSLKTRVRSDGAGSAGLLADGVEAMSVEREREQQSEQQERQHGAGRTDALGPERASQSRDDDSRKMLARRMISALDEIGD
jgi:hypothetical protein